MLGSAGMPRSGGRAQHDARSGRGEQNLALSSCNDDDDDHDDEDDHATRSCKNWKPNICIVFAAPRDSQTVLRMDTLLHSYENIKTAAIRRDYLKFEEEFSNVQVELKKKTIRAMLDQKDIEKFQLRMKQA